MPGICTLFFRLFHTIANRNTVAVGLLLVLGAPAALAEQKRYGMLSIEWLVDESDVIAVVREGQSPNEPKVVRAIKGNAASVDWPTIRSETRVDFFEPPSPDASSTSGSERARLLFVRGRAELLQSVSLERDDYIGSINKTTHPDYKPYPRRGVETRFYGVTQFGELVLTSSKLLRSIEDRLKTAREPIKLREGVGKHLGGEGKLPARYAPDVFPLNNDDEVYYLVVPYDTSRRDHFLTQLSNGDAAEKLYAISELSIFRDASARKAIEQAADCKEAVEVFRFEKSTGEVVAWTAADVRAAATTELNKRP